MTTFLFFAFKEGLKFISYKSQAKGIMERTPSGLSFTKIEVMPVLELERKEDEEKAKELFKKAEEDCLISRSIKSEVELSPRINISINASS